MAEAIEIPEGNVTLKFEGDERELVADRKYLANRFKYFETLFKSDYNEANADVINLKAGGVLSFESVDWLYRFTAHSKATDGNFESLLKAADYLQLNEEYLENLYNQAKNRSPRTILATFNLLHRLLGRRIQADYYNRYSDYNEFVKMVGSGNNLKTLIFERGWTDLDPEHINKILSYGQGECVAIDILVQGIKIWVNHDYETRKEFLPGFVQHIRRSSYNCTDMESVLEMILNFEPRKMDWNYVAIDILLEKLKLTSLKQKVKIEE